MCHLKNLSTTGKNIGYDVYKEIKGEEDYNKKMKEADTVRKLMIVYAQTEAPNCWLEHSKM